jgi:F-type H+-transporting ATPase subunit delta
MKFRSRAARRYARALFDLARDEGVTARILQDMAWLKRSTAGSPDLAAFVPNYLLPRAARLGILESLWAPHVHPLTWRFIRLVEAKRRLNLLEDICAEVLHLDEEQQGIVRGNLATAFALSAEEVGAIAAGVGRRLGKQLVLQAKQDSSLLGGYCLQVGDRIYDLSLAARLRMLRQTMMAGCGQGN